MDNIVFDLEETYIELKERALEEGIFEKEGWDELVEEVLDEKREFAELDNDADWTEIQEALQARFDEFAEEIPEM
ncbi:hypothetical protein HY633_05005 [Candidatus Uhrbacteria bacterium]|nr:hypothetical protein [Candidatus Uhrbacteria bacterium]